jgi:hypothetical protein
VRGDGVMLFGKVGLPDVVGRVEDPIRAYSFRVKLPIIFGNADVVALQVKSVQFPFWLGIDTEGLRWKGQGYYVLPSEVETHGELQMEFWESKSSVVQLYFNTWRGMIVKDPFEAEPFRELKDVPSKWMKDVYIDVIGSGGVPVGIYKFSLCYPTKVDVLRFGYDNNEVLTVSVTLVFHSVLLG